MFWIFRRKPIVERYEEEFKPEEMKKRRVYYDVSFRTDDPERVRVFMSELLEEFEYRPVINKLTRFEEIEEEIFVGGRLKPVRGVIKGFKTLDLGPKYPNWIIVGAFFAVFFFLVSFIRNWDLMLLKCSIIIGIITFILVFIRKKVNLYVWIKIAGVYDPSQEKADIKLTMAGDISKYDRYAESKLEEDMNEMFIAVSNRYLKRITPEEERYYVIKEEKKPWEIEESKKDEIIKMIAMIRKDLRELDSRLARGEIDPETYKEVKRNLEERLEKYETLLEFFE